MSGFKPYPAYKDSGVEWLGEVPDHWVMGSLKNMALIRNGKDYKEVESSDGEYPVIGSGGQFTTATHYLYEGESVLLGRKGTIDKPLYINGRFWTVDTMFYTEISRETCAKFFYYCSLTIPFDYYSTSTALPSMTQADLLNHPTAIPSKLEQTQIARFLDHETARIDALIEEQQRLIELLKEKRQSVISHAVTKGLDPTVPMKDSGVEWLGEVPTHWESWKVSHAYGELGSGTTPPTTESEWYENGTVPWVTTGELRESVILETKKLLSPKALSAFPALRLHPAGSLAIAMYGATIGRLGILGVDATVNQACCLLARPSYLHVKFTFYWLLVFKQNIIDLFASGGGQPNINQEVIGNLKIPAPGVHEQAQIARFLDHETARIDALIEEANTGVVLLKERRSALISAAVTGKIDVRNWQPPAGHYPVSDTQNRTEPEAV